MSLIQQNTLTSLSRFAAALLAGTALIACQAETVQISGTQTETAASSQATSNTSAAAITMMRLNEADSEPGQWLAHGRTNTEQRFAPLDQINTENVSELSLDWSLELDTNRGQEATPIVVDGMMYFTTAWSKVVAVDAVTGEKKWQYDPEVDPEWAVNACCDVVNRGAAAYDGKIISASLDGRLFALDAATGELIWEKLTIDKSKPYTITGAPRIVKGNIIIGNGGAEYGVRGYVAAYDPDNGEEVWRFYTVPGNPEDGFENDAMEAAAETWTGEWWKLGGGGTVWDSVAYDEETDLLYVGVGNGSPWNQKIRSPEGGDNLYLSSIVALDPDTGEYVWHYQTTPGETWDYTATQHMIVADLPIDGETRKVVMQAPKNGFFYVIDAYTGEFISANNFVPVNWASGVDPETGRPIQNPDARYYDKPGEVSLVLPGPGGAHSWQPMSFNPDTGLVYIPANISAFPYAPDEDFEPGEIGFNTGADFHMAAMPPIQEVRDQTLSSLSGPLIAWNPVTQEAEWSVPRPGNGNGGTLTTAGNLVFQGTKGGLFGAYNAETGEELWSVDADIGIIAAPVSYEIDGTQYVAVLTGWGGIEALAPGIVSRKGALQGPRYGRMMVFSLEGEAEMPEKQVIALPPFSETGEELPEEAVAHGGKLYASLCGVCHGDAAIGGGVLPDLRRSAYITESEFFNEVLLDGLLAENGMVAFDSVLSEEDAEHIRLYLLARAQQDKALEAAADSSGGGE